MSNNPDIRESKRRLRHRLRQALAALSEKTRLSSSIAIRQRLLQLPEWTRARTVLLFYSQPPEPDMLPLWRIATQESKTVAFPSFVAEHRLYIARAAGAWQPGATLPPGAFGIPEPPITKPQLQGNQLDFVVVPGVGFSPDGHRLGRGGGFYDRLLIEVKGFRCGVAYDEQMVEPLPTEPHDICCDCILSPSREWRCPPARA